MFTGIWAMVTSRLFDREFLVKHNIMFDEEVPFTEDGLFLIEACGKVDRICYLTQFIGYRYLIHYDVYAPILELSTRIGESAILTATPTVCYLLSSGSMGTLRSVTAQQASAVFLYLILHQST